MKLLREIEVKEFVGLYLKLEVNLLMVAKSSKVYTKLQGNVDKMNVRLSS